MECKLDFMRSLNFALSFVEGKAGNAACQKRTFNSILLKNKFFAVRLNSKLSPSIWSCAENVAFSTACIRNQRQKSKENLVKAI